MPLEMVPMLKKKMGRALCHYVIENIYMTDFIID